MKSISIRSIGLKQYLKDTAAAHDHYDYDNLDRFIKTAEEKHKNISISSLAIMFRVSRNTMEKWVKIYREEQQPDMRYTIE